MSSSYFRSERQAADSGAPPALTLVAMVDNSTGVPAGQEIEALAATTGDAGGIASVSAAADIPTKASVDARLTLINKIHRRIADHLAQQDADITAIRTEVVEIRNNLRNAGQML